MRRNIILIGLVLTVAALFPVAAQAKYELGPGEIPVYVPDTPQALSPDDRSYMRGTEQQLVPVAGSQVQSPDDRSFARGAVQQPAPVVSDDGIQVDTYGVTGFGLALLLLAGGTTLVIRHRRKTPLSTA